MEGVVTQEVLIHRVGDRISDKMLARLLVNVVHKLRARETHDLHEVVYQMESQALCYRLGKQQQWLVCVATDCVRYGWQMFICNKVVSYLTWPEKLTKRWKYVCKLSLETGLLVARQQVLSQQSGT